MHGSHDLAVHPLPPHPHTMHREDFLPASTRSHFRRQLTAIGQRIEEHMANPFFCVDAVLNARAEQTAVFSGAAHEVEQATWAKAAERTDIELPGRPADVLVIGMPRSFHYGPGMGSNPILILQAIGSSLVRAGAALDPHPVVICAPVCDGWFNDEWFPPYREVYDLFQHCASVDQMTRFEDDMANRARVPAQVPLPLRLPPVPCLSMLYMGGIAHQRARAIYIVGAREPGYARGMGCIPVDTFTQAMSHAERHGGADPSTLAIPLCPGPPFTHGPRISQVSAPYEWYEGWWSPSITMLTSRIRGSLRIPAM